MPQIVWSAGSEDTDYLFRLGALTSESFVLPVSRIRDSFNTTFRCNFLIKLFHANCRETVAPILEGLLWRKLCQQLS